MSNFDRAPLVAGFDQLRAQISDADLVARTQRAAVLNLEARAAEHPDGLAFLQELVDALGLHTAVRAIQLERAVAGDLSAEQILNLSTPKAAGQ